MESDILRVFRELHNPFYFYYIFSVYNSVKIYEDWWGFSYFMHFCAVAM